MIEKLDVTHLENLMEESGSWWAWSIADGKHWLTNKHIALIIDQEGLDDCEEGWDFLDCLERNFEKKTPEASKALTLYHGCVNESDVKLVESLKNMFVGKMPDNPGTITPLIYADGLMRQRWIKFKDFNLFVQDKYMSLLWNATLEKAHAAQKGSPLFLCDGNFIILPFRDTGDKEKTDELEAFEEFLKTAEI